MVERRCAKCYKKCGQYKVCFPCYEKQQQIISMDTELKRMREIISDYLTDILLEEKKLAENNIDDLEWAEKFKETESKVKGHMKEIRKITRYNKKYPMVFDYKLLKKFSNKFNKKSHEKKFDWKKY